MSFFMPIITDSCGTIVYFNLYIYTNVYVCITGEFEPKFYWYDI